MEHRRQLVDGLPKASTVVCWSAGETVVVSAGTQQADSIADGGSLTVSGGSLTLENSSDASAPSGTVTVGGGTLTIKDGASTGSLTESAGALTGSVSLAISGSYVWSGGSVNGGGGSLKIQQASGGGFSIAPTRQTYFEAGSIEQIRHARPVGVISSGTSVMSATNMHRVRVRSSSQRPRTSVVPDRAWRQARSSTSSSASSTVRSSSRARCPTRSPSARASTAPTISQRSCVGWLAIVTSGWKLAGNADREVGQITTVESASRSSA